MTNIFYYKTKGWKSQKISCEKNSKKKIKNACNLFLICY